MISELLLGPGMKVRLMHLTLFKHTVMVMNDFFFLYFSIISKNYICGKCLHRVKYQIYLNTLTNYTN